MIVGYARASSKSTSQDSQIKALTKAGCEKIFEEKNSTTNDNRPELQAALNFLKSGDTLIVTRLDRCARNIKDLHLLIDTLNSKGVSLKALEQNLDTSTSAGKSMLELLGIVNDFESDLRAERQAQGIKSAQAKGVKFGRTAKFSDAKTKEAIALQAKGLKNQEIADKYGIARSTLLRYIANHKKACNEWDDSHLNKKKKRNYPKRKKYPLTVTVHKNSKNIKYWQRHDKTNCFQYDRVTLQFGTDKNNWFYKFLTSTAVHPLTGDDMLEDIYNMVIASYPPDKQEIEGELIPYFNELHDCIPEVIAKLDNSYVKWEKKNKHLMENQEDIDIASLDTSDPFNPVPAADDMSSGVDSENVAAPIDKTSKDEFDIYKHLGIEKP